MKIRIYGRRCLTQKQAQNCSKYKMWSISPFDNVKMKMVSNKDVDIHVTTDRQNDMNSKSIGFFL